NNIENNIQSNSIGPVLNGTIVSNNNVINSQEVRNSTSLMKKDFSILPVTNNLLATSNMIEQIDRVSSNINYQNQYLSTTSKETIVPCTIINSSSIPKTATL
ncbi:unnamed protein product, partial [Rotaria socialis]